MPESHTTTTGENPATDHESVLERLAEVASTEYPFPMPERVKPPKDQRINLTSAVNLRPLLFSVVVFLLNVACPVLAVVGAVGAAWLSSGSTAGTVLGALALVCATRTLLDPFVVHFVTNGRFGGLGRGLGGEGEGSGSAREGFFCNPETAVNRRIRDRLERFVGYAPTPYLYSGDLLTMAPFLMFKGSIGGRVNYKRYWVRVPDAPAPDGDEGPSKTAPPVGDDDTAEAVALDIIFPEEGYREDKPTFLVLHGLNGGSTEPYVLDLARRAPKEGHTVAVMINRGLMKTPMRGDSLFHGARTSDVGCAVDALHRALYGTSRFDDDDDDDSKSSPKKKKSKIVLVGFSMGGIIAANYAAKSGPNSGLAGAVSFSGMLCVAKNILATPSGKHSEKVWQTALAWALKATICKPNMGRFVRRGITVRDVEAVASVHDIDAQLVCRYNGFDTVRDYYRDMSAGGAGDEHGLRRLKGTKIPLLAVHAIDDPIGIYESALADEVPETDHVMLLATKHGGHIGWPTGMLPSKNRWNFMIEIALEFAAEVGGGGGD